MLAATVVVTFPRAAHAQRERGTVIEPGHIFATEPSEPATDPAREARTGSTLQITGGVLFGAAYLPSVGYGLDQLATGAPASQPVGGSLLVPVVGPFIAMGLLPTPQMLSYPATSISPTAGATPLSLLGVIATAQTPGNAAIDATNAARQSAYTAAEALLFVDGVVQATGLGLAIAGSLMRADSARRGHAPSVSISASAPGAPAGLSIRGSF